MRREGKDPKHGHNPPPPKDLYDRHGQRESALLRAHTDQPPPRLKVHDRTVIKVRTQLNRTQFTPDGKPTPSHLYI